MTQLRQNPLDFGVLNSLRQHCEATQSYAVWAEALEHHARAAGEADGDPVELGRLHYELGNLYRNQLGRSDRALAHYRTAIDLDAAQRPALAAARAISAEAGEWEEVADLLTRESDSLPEGPKRAGLLVELAKVQRERLGQSEAAENALREAASYVPEDLQVQHELATMLLEHADQSRNAAAAARKRREAADVLSAMARGVSDDYAMAYVDSALDALPDHADALEQLEALAPKLGRSDTLAPRWLAAIRSSQNRSQARALRIKMANAYLSVGQAGDVRIVLEPLLADGDPEAHALARRAAHVSQDPAETLASKRSARRGSQPDHEVEELLSSEISLENEDDLEAAEPGSDDLLDAEDDEDDGRDSLANELSDLRAQLDEGETPDAGSPLADLATLERAGRDARDASGDDGLSELLDDDSLLDSREELLDSGELSTVNDPSSSERRLPEPEPEPAQRASSLPPKLPTKAPPKKARTRDVFDELDFQPMREEDEPDPFAEETQPRATPLTLAELTALKGDDHSHQPRDRERIIMAPDGELKGRDPDSEVTTLTPAEDPRVTELRSLRTELAKRLRFRDRRGAAEVAQTLLDRGQFDAEAIEALEEHYRLARDFRGLRDLSMRLAHEASFPADVRASRLREAVMLSESKLGDQEGAARALRDLLGLEPHDVDAFEKLKKLLRRAQQWDELAALYSQREGDVSDVKARAELLRELGALHREKRGAVQPAIEAYASARAIDPGVADDEVALSELYVSHGQFAPAAEMYEARVARLEPSQRAPLWATLAQLYEEKLHDDERAQRALQSWRALEPRKVEPLHALIRVLERRGEHAALADALGDQLAFATPSDRVRLHVRIAELALQRLDQPARAADAYAEAIALAPQESKLWSDAEPSFERAGRATELDELLWNLAQGARDRALSSSLFEHLALTRAERGDRAGAILAREAQYALAQEPKVLAELVALLRSADRPNDLSKRLDELARRSDSDTARALRLERAEVLAHKLNDPQAAKAELERSLAELSADDTNALRKLIELCITTGDTKRRASAQERLIKLAPSLPARVELAVELVDIYEHELNDAQGATRALSAWTALEPENPSPYMRLAPLLAQAGRKRELLDTLDKLSALANSDEEAGEFVLRAARTAIELEDFDGAWNRLVPRVVEKNDADAERVLRELTRLAGRGEQLASLYVGLAQRSEDGDVERRRWADAARVFEQELSAHDRALEAMLRALAKQLDNRELLAEVERLAGRAQAWARLGQVYDTIVRRAENTETRVQLLMRHARLLETHASDLDTAFERVWLAYQLDPANDETYAEVRRLAAQLRKDDELLSAYERRAQSTATREARIEALLEACAVAHHELEDTARAVGYLNRAVSLSADNNALLDSVETRVRALDVEHPPIAGRGLLAELTGVYSQLAQESARTPVLAANWLSRSARIHELKLDDPDAAFRALERASTLSPSDESLLDELTRVAGLGGNWEPLAKHLQHAADVAIDSNSSSAALSRLGGLCERELQSPSRAADAYEQLVRLRPKDADASRRLRHCLRASERYDELLIAIDRELFMLKPEEGKRELLKQAAETWEFGLKNRYEALDTWKKVIAIAPSDPDAVAALSRLRSRPRADESLLDGDVVVLPEDLRPSLVEVTNVPAADAESREPLAEPDAREQALVQQAEAHEAEAYDDEHAADDERSAPSSADDSAALDALMAAPLDEVPASEHIETAAREELASADDVTEDAGDDALDDEGDEPAQPAESGEFEANGAYVASPEAPTASARHEDELVDEVTNAAPMELPAHLEAAAAQQPAEARGEPDDDAREDGDAREQGDAREDHDAQAEHVEAAALRDDDDVEVDDEHELELEPDALTHSGSIDLSDQLHDYDPEVTLPLDREERRQQVGGQQVGSQLDALSSLVGRKPTQPPPPPPAAVRGSRVPPPPPKSGRPPEDE